MVCAIQLHKEQTCSDRAFVPHAMEAIGTISLRAAHCFLHSDLTEEGYSRLLHSSEQSSGLTALMGAKCRIVLRISRLA
jgi:hypothetical protein